MIIFRATDASLNPADPRTFVGSARMRRLAQDESTVATHVYHVEFDAGGRTNWHTHSGPQWLFIVDGTVRVQRWGESAQDVAKGDAVMFQPGEKHWHGAAPGSAGTHVAVNLDAKTEWLEPVSDEQYAIR